MLLLWFGWYGFNGGSVLSADPAAVSYVVVTTTLAATTGVLVAAMGSWHLTGRPDLSLALNGALAGLVAVTAGADVLSPAASVLVGAIGGGLLLASSLAMAHYRIDDPVGAVPVHLVCGVWGTVAVGLFVPEVDVAVQLLGVFAVGGMCLLCTAILLQVLDLTLGMRVEPHEETGGLDAHEHGAEAYGIPLTTPDPPAVAVAK